MDASPDSFGAKLYEHCNTLKRLSSPSGANRVKITGRSLDLAAVVAVARHGVSVEVDAEAFERVAESEAVLSTSLERGLVVYGVNTGFGGSADTRTQQVEALQRKLMRGLHYGIISSASTAGVKRRREEDTDTTARVPVLPLDDPVAATCMPEAWVRAAMLVRLNSLAFGASAVKLSTIRSLESLIEKDVVPQIPLRGSISASGDLSPLSYVGGVMQGKSSLKAWYGERAKGQRRLIRADRVLARASILPISLGAKEGLAIVNGTAPSAAVAALAVHEVSLQAALSQVLTAMTVEALRGTDESFDPFFAETRPHPGQRESAANILALLEGSKLVYRDDGSAESSLRQDRYSIRTASQWIGPVLEDLSLAHDQVRIEINSVTDNPLVDTRTGNILHGGNFQAKSMTSATEKTRQACQTIGHMLFAQCTELINPATSRGLPPNLVADEPNESFIWKGTDLMIAALASELGYLANPVGTHVKSAEMGNQALNSLALISGRYTLEASTVLAQLAAAHLVAVCQALDLRSMQIHFLETLLPDFHTLTRTHIGPVVGDASVLENMLQQLWKAFCDRIDQLVSVPSEARFLQACRDLQPLLLPLVSHTADGIAAMLTWSEVVPAAASQALDVARNFCIAHPDATPLLGTGTARIYRFVRQELKVPFLNEDGLATPPAERTDDKPDCEGLEEDDASPLTMGGNIGLVYNSLRDGTLYAEVIACIYESHHTAKQPQLGKGTTA